MHSFCEAPCKVTAYAVTRAPALGWAEGPNMIVNHCYRIVAAVRRSMAGT